MSTIPQGFVQHENSPLPQVTELARIVPRDVVIATTPSEVELNRQQLAHQLNGPKGDMTEWNTSALPTLSELEQDLPPTLKNSQAVDALVQSATLPYMNRWRVVSAGVVFFLIGVNDGATGALIPYIETEYKIGYAVVSLIFVTQAVGYISAAPLCQAIDSKLGRSRACMLATAILSLGYVALSCAPPFPVVAISFFFLGSGQAIFLSMTNTFIVNLLNGTVILGIMHGLYGVGGIISPLAATAMLSHGLRWSFYYLIPLAIVLPSIAFMGWAYRGFENDATIQLLTSLERTASRRASTAGEPSKTELLKKALKNRTTLLGSLFIFFYQGIEVAISGWIISFLINYRKGNPAQVGNVTSGFWGGITLGRFVLTHFAYKIGEKVVVPCLIIGAAAFQLLVWLLPNVIGNAVAESIVGLLLGPVYPCATAVFARSLPRNIQISSLSLVTSMGSSGGAVTPFVTGLLAERLGTVALHPIVLVSCALMILFWLLLPKVDKRRD